MFCAGVFCVFPTFFVADIEKSMLQSEDAQLALNPPPAYPADPLRYYHQYLSQQVCVDINNHFTSLH